LKWEAVSSDWQAPFRPIATGKFTKWPSVTDLFPWQHTGIECKRTWPIECSRDVLKARWKSLLDLSDRSAAMKESGDRTISLSQIDLFDSSKVLPAIKDLLTNQQVHKIVSYAFRSFDRQYLLADNRLISRPRPNLWLAYSDRQIHFTSLFNHPLGGGPAITVCANIPDRHHFRGSYGGKDVLPLYRNAKYSEPNILPGLLDMLNKAYGRIVNPEDFAGYVYGILAQPEYTRRFANELAGKEVRVPLTKDKKLFTKVSDFGKELIWLHTYGERLHDADHPAGQIPKGKAQCTKAVSDQESKYPNEFKYDETTKKLHVGDGEFAPVPLAVWEFEVSGLKVVQSWLGYRMRERSGKKSSPLDDIRPRTWTREFTRELLELLWVLEITVAGYPKQQQLLEAVLESDLFTAAELPAVPEEAREAPKVTRSRNLNPQACLEIEE
jgi:predicted helicase